MKNSLTSFPTSDEEYVEPQRMCIIPAFQLRKQSVGDGLIEDYVNGILGIIEEDMETAMENRMSYSITEIETHFDVPYMEQKKSQKYVYYYLLQALRRAGYRPRMECRRQKVFIHMQWTSPRDAELEVQMGQFIQAHMIQRSEAPPKPLSRRRRRRPVK